MRECNFQNECKENKTCYTSIILSLHSFKYLLGYIHVTVHQAMDLLDKGSNYNHTIYTYSSFLYLTCNEFQSNLLILS